MAKTVSQLRIIAGKWRSRKISFLPLPGVRPTTDANRETLFNWVSGKIIAANCLDLFAGSGALGFEALSRGAKHVCMVDASFKVTQKLQENASLLLTEDITFICAKLPQQFSKIPPQTFDIVFLDPPFHQGLLAPCCELLARSSLLASNFYIYIEAEKDLEIKTILPAAWEIVRHKFAGQVQYLLARNSH